MTTEKLEHSRIKATFDITAEDFEVALDKSFAENVKKVTIKGFRKGKAPREIFEKNYGVESLYEEALNYIFNQKVEELYKSEEYKNKIVSQFVPELDWNNIKRGSNFTISLLFDVRPEFNLPAYKGIEVKKANTEVSEDEVNESINRLLQPKAKREDKEDKTIALGDIAEFDYKGYVDDEAFEGGEAKNYSLKIGSKHFIPGFEEQMVGMKEGETKDVLVTFPEKYQAENLAGKPAKFVVTVNKVFTEVLPELTDDFIKSLDIKDVNTKDELVEYKKQELVSQKENSEIDRQTNDVINFLINNTVVDMPESLIQRRIDLFRNNYEEQAKRYNIPLETFLQLIGTNKEKFDKDTAEQGKRNAIFIEVMAKVVEEEKLQPTIEEINEKLGITEDNKKKVSSQQFESAFSEITYDKFVKFLLDNAKYVD